MHVRHPVRSWWPHDVFRLHPVRAMSGRGRHSDDHRVTIFVIAVLVVLPSLGLLFVLVQRNLVEETSRPAERPPDDGAEAAGAPTLAS